MIAIGILLILLGLLTWSSGGFVALGFGLVILAIAASRKEPQKRLDSQPPASPPSPEKHRESSKPTGVLAPASRPASAVRSPNLHGPRGSIPRSPHQPTPTRSGRILFVDTETTGLPLRRYAQFTEVSVWPRIVSFAWAIVDSDSGVVSWGYNLVKPTGFVIPVEATLIHGITTAMAEREGSDLRGVLADFSQRMQELGPVQVTAHNAEFDVPIVAAELYRLGLPTSIARLPRFCTMQTTTALVGIRRGRGYKWPKLCELYQHLFGRAHSSGHHSLGDLLATIECYCELCNRGVVNRAVKVCRPNNLPSIPTNRSAAVAKRITLLPIHTPTQAAAKACSAEIQVARAPELGEFTCQRCGRLVAYRILCEQQDVRCPDCGRSMLIPPARKRLAG